MMIKKFAFSIVLGTLVVFLVGFGPAVTHATTATFNFDTDTVGTSTPFTDTNNGVSATFSSSGGPGGFIILSTNFFKTLTGNELLDILPASFLDLAITFSLPISSISFDFALNSPSDPTVELIGSLSNGQSFSATGVFFPGFNFGPEGSIALVSLTPFNTVTLSSTASLFAIDNITVETAAAPVPEPSTLLLLGSGLIGLGRYGRKFFSK